MSYKIKDLQLKMGDSKILTTPLVKLFYCWTITLWFAKLGRFQINPFRPDPWTKRKNSLKFLFSHFFMVPQKVLQMPLRPS